MGRKDSSLRPIGNAPFRQLKSFGVAGVLGEEARVFFNTIFNTRNLGRVNDLLAARLLKSGVDELRLRQILELSAFEAYRVQINDARERKQAAIEKAKAAAAAAGKEYVAKEEDDKLDQPITIECGVDGEKIGVSISMTLSPKLQFDPKQLVERVNSQRAESEFDRLGVQIFNVADLFIVRWQEETRRLEFVSLLSFGTPAAKQPTELVVVSVEEGKNSPKPQEYTEAGDLDYDALLASDTRLQGKKGQGFSSKLVKKAIAATEGDTRVTSGGDEEDPEQLLNGADIEDEASQKVGGDGEGEEDSSITLGGEAGDGKESRKRVAGKKTSEEEDEVAFDADSEQRSIKKKKVKGKNVGSEDEEVEIESDGGEEGESQIKFKGGGEGSAEADESMLVSGDAGENKRKGKLKVKKGSKGSADGAESGEDDDSQDDGDEEFVIESEGQKREKKSKFTFKGGPQEPAEIEEEEIAYGRGGKRIRGEKDEVEEQEEVVETDATPAKRIRKFMRRIWPFGKKDEIEDGVAEDQEEQSPEEIVVSGDGAEEEPDQTTIRFKGGSGAKSKEREYRFRKSEDGGAPEEENQNDAVIIKGERAEGETGTSENEKRKDSAQSSADHEASDQIMKTFEENVIDKTVDRVQREAIKLKEEIKDERTKRWVDNLTRDLIAEKASLRETAKRISMNVRQKEFEFKTKQTALEEEIRKRDEQLIAQKHSLNRTREQLTQVSRSLDRMKQVSQEAADAASFKQKYGLAQKVLQTTKDENSLLQAKIEEMRIQMAQLQLGGKNKGPSQTEFNVLQSKYDRAYKQIDELRRQNQRMMLEATNRRSVGGNPDVEEFKKKLETANRMQAVAKKENELLQGRVAKMQRDDKALRNEILRLQEALRNATNKKPSGGTGTAA